jgi:hypothetical protein
MGIFKIIITSLSMLALMFSTSVLKIYADTNNQEDILEVIRNNDFLDIKKIEFDKNNKAISDSIEDVNINSKGVALPDGKYILNRGTGWVLGGDKSFAKSGFAGPGEDIRILEGTTASYEHTVMSGVAAEFDFDVVKSAVEITYEHSINKSELIMSGFEMRAPSDKNVYFKTYNTFNRYDLIKVQNGNIIGHSATFEPEGSWAKYVTYNKGEVVNQDALKERVNRCVLGEPEQININNSITVKGSDHIKNVDILFNANSNTIELANRSNTRIHPGTGNNEYFKIELTDSNYNLKSSMIMNGNDYSKDSKYDSFNGVEYKIGDIINIYHKEPFLLSINGPTSGESQNNKQYKKYKITENGLESLKTNNTVADGKHRIYLGLNSDRWITCNEYYQNEVKPVMITSHDNSRGSYWSFEYDGIKDAYKIRHYASQQYLTHNATNLTVQNISNDNSYYWILERQNDGKYVMINLKSGLAVDIKGGDTGSGSYVSVYKPHYGENQKFVIS